MNIDEMTDQEKSVMLARAMDLEIIQHPVHDNEEMFVIPDSWEWEWEWHDDFYYPKWMALARRVLNWAYHNIVFDWDYWLIATYEPGEDGEQQGWLDKILELAIEAGLIPD